MPVEIKDMTFDKVAIGPVSVRVYQGAEYAKGAPVLLYFHGGAFTKTGLRHCPLAECIASTIRPMESARVPSQSKISSL